MSQEKEAQKKFHKTREDKELEKVIAFENKIKVLDDNVYKTGQSVQTMNMLNHNCKTSFVKLEFLKKAQRANPRLYDIGCYNDNLALMLALESDEMICLAQESRSKLIVKCERLKKELSKSNITSKSFEALQQHAINLELALQQSQDQIQNDKAFKKIIMDSESAHTVAASKVPMLKPENENFAPKTIVVDGVKKVIPPTTVEEKAQKRLEDAKSLLEAIKKRFGGNAATKKTQRNILKQHTNEAVNTAHGVSVVSTKVSAANSTNVDNLNYLEEIDLRWQIAMLTMRARRFLKNTGRKVYINDNETIGFDKSKVECYNCHKRGHFAKECKTLRNQENRNRESTRRSMPVETTTSNALISCDGLVLTLMYLLIQTVHYLVWKMFSVVEARLLVYKENESVYEDDIKLLKREIYLKELAITELRRKLELAQKQKDEIQLTVENFENSSKNLKKLLDCHIVDICKTGLGYNAVPPPYIRNFMPLKHVLSSLKEFVNEPIVNEPTVKKSVVETSEAKAGADKPKVVRKNNGAPIIKDWVSDSEEEDMPRAKKEKKTVKSSFAKIKFVKSKEQVKSPRKTTVKQGSNFEMINKACYVCGSFDHLQYDCDYHQRQFNNKKMVKPVWNYTQRVNHQNFSRMTHPSPKRNMVPKAVLMRSGLVSLTTARPVNTAQPRTIVNSARPMTNVFNKAHSTVIRPINNKTTTKNSNLIQRVNTVSGKNVNTVRPKQYLMLLRETSASILKRFDYIDAQGRSKYMTGKMSYLTNFEEIDEGYVAFGATKDETSGILKSFITRVENLIDQMVKVIRCDNRTEFKNKEMNQFYERNSIRREFSVAITPQQNRVAERKNRTLIEAARTMLADSKLPTTFWAEAVNTACYVQNSVLVIKPHNKTTYELFLGRKPALGFMRPFRCTITILNTIDHLGKFDGKVDEGFFHGYSINSKAFRVFNSRTRIVKENMHVQFSENTPNIKGSGPNWLFDIDALTKSINYKPVVSSPDVGFKPSGDNEKKVTEEPRKEGGDPSNKNDSVNSTNNINTASDGNITNNINTVSSTINTAGIEVNVASSNTSIELPNDSNMPELEDIVYSDDYEDVGSDADMNNLNTFMHVSHISTTRIHKDHPVEQIIIDLNSAPQTIKMIKNLKEHEEIDNDEVFAPVARIEAIGLFLAYASFKDFMVYQMDVKSAFLYGKIKEEVYVCQPPGFDDPDFPDRVYKIEKALYGLHQAPRAWYETLSTYLLDNAFQRGKIDKTLFIRRDKGYILLDQVYVDDIIFGSTKKSLCIEFEKMMHKKFQMSSMGELTFFLGLQVKQKEDGIFITSTPMETQKPLLKDEDVCACARYQVNLKVSHFHAVKRIFRYLKGQPKLGLWYLKDSPFDFVAYTHSDYAGASLDRKSTTGGCQFHGCRLISWQCKKQTVVANSTTEAESVAA
ncbi:putative ribonuclease H-like domain-containing protein [Tanacetum coccineum]